jgi:hypothetical protein
MNSFRCDDEIGDQPRTSAELLQSDRGQQIKLTGRLAARRGGVDDQPCSKRAR